MSIGTGLFSIGVTIWWGGIGVAICAGGIGKASWSGGIGANCAGDAEVFHASELFGLAMGFDGALGGGMKACNLGAAVGVDSPEEAGG